MAVGIFVFVPAIAAGVLKLGARRAAKSKDD